MIFFISDGRLGNQLFQYAFLKTVAKKNERIIVLNMNKLLDVMEVHNEKFINMNCNKYLFFLFRSIVTRCFFRLSIKLRLISYIKQDRNKTSALPYYKKITGLLPFTYVETDFFQSEKFFDLDKLDFEIKKKYVDNAKIFMNSMPKEATPAFVHVRRGDYVYEKYLDSRGIDLPLTYYSKAMSIIETHVTNPFYIFLTDDKEFVRCCFKHITNKIISNNDEGTDLAIMSLCEYGICANSSFSWWGAYLMKNKKLVIFPKYWYGWKQKVESHIDIQPSWAKIIEVES